MGDAMELIRWVAGVLVAVLIVAEVVLAFISYKSKSGMVRKNVEGFQKHAANELLGPLLKPGESNRDAARRLWGQPRI
jgi:hypothetical protein